MKIRLTALVLVGLALLMPIPAMAFDPEQTFAKGTFVLSGEGSYGWETDFAESSRGTLEFWDVGIRFGFLPFEPLLRGTPLYGTFEIGLEPFYQRYVEPQHRFWAGLSAVMRYHFLGLGRVVPYVELAGSAGGTDLKLPEIHSDFAFLVFGGVGASVFLTDKTAAYAGYRFQHVSNGGTSSPNRGFESNVVVVGYSLLF